MILTQEQVERVAKSIMESSLKTMLEVGIPEKETSTALAIILARLVGWHAACVNWRRKDFLKKVTDSYDLQVHLSKKTEEK